MPVIIFSVKDVAGDVARSVAATLVKSRTSNETLLSTIRAHIDGYRAARKKVIGDDTLPASTLLLIDGLASPDMLIEIEATAAKA